jgi:hypothetical protein
MSTHICPMLTHTYNLEGTASMTQHRWSQWSFDATSSPAEGQQPARHLHITVGQGFGGPRSSSSCSCTCICITNHFFSLTDTAASASANLITTHLQPYVISVGLYNRGCFMHLMHHHQVTPCQPGFLVPKQQTNPGTKKASACSAKQQ